jgi:hypothetical protein
VSRVYLVLVEDAFDFFGDLMRRSAAESSRALASRRGPGRCRGSAADPRRRRHERLRPSEATATHAAIVKTGTPDRSRRRAICGTAGRRTLGPPRGIGRRGRRAQARKTLSLFRGTEGSNPPPSRGESVSTVRSRAGAKSPALLRRSARAWGRERGRAGGERALLGSFSLTGIDAVPLRESSGVQRRAGRGKPPPAYIYPVARFSLRAVGAARPSPAAGRVPSDASQ